MAGLSFMQRRPSGIYEFRRRLPQLLAGRSVPDHAKGALAELINPTTGNFKQYLTVSLRTNDQKLAKRRDLDEARRVTDLFDLGLQLIKGGKPEAEAPESSSMPSAEEIEAHFLHVLLAADERERNEGDPRRFHQTTAERAQWPDLEDARIGEMGMAEGHLEALGALNAELAGDYRKAYAKRRTDIIRPELNAYLTEKRAGIDPSSSKYHEAGIAVLRAHVRFYELVEMRQAGKDVATPEPLRVAKVPKLSEAFTMWKNGTVARGGKKPAYSTVREAERAVRYFREWHGDLPLGDITKEKARDFRNGLSKLPTRLSTKQRTLPLRRLVEEVKTKSPIIHADSVNKYLTMLVAIVSAVEREGEMDGVSGFSNPFSGMSLTVDKRSPENLRRLFSVPQLDALFAQEVFTKGKRPIGGSGEAAFWLPLMGLLTGARLGELAGLRLKDIQKDPETGIWFIDISTDGGRSIKTASSRRQVPIHSELIRLGLLRYRDALLEGGMKPEANMWPLMKTADENRQSSAWSKWFNRYLRDAALIKDPSIVFHSFRHTFKRLARDAGIAEDLGDALTGHTGGGIGRSYGAGFGLKALHEAIEKIEAPKVVKGLAGWNAQGGKA